MMGPCVPINCSLNRRAGSVTLTRSGSLVNSSLKRHLTRRTRGRHRDLTSRKIRMPVRPQFLEKAQGLRAVAHQNVLGLLVMIQHHLVGFPADAGLLVTSECRMRRIGVK